MRWKGAPQLVDRLAWALTSTWTYHIFGSDHVRAACRASATGHVMFVLWHQDLLQLTGCIRGGGMHLAALVSRSGDGALIAVHLERRGVRTIRGSSHRGAAAAAKELLVAAQDGFHPAIAIDGPKGPARQTRAGPLEIARLAGMPIVPLAARATHDIRLPTWDRLRIPLPRAHVAMLMGEPIYPPTSAPAAPVLEQRRRQLAITLNELAARAADHAGQRDRFPAPRYLDWLT
jgi:lysophospholipid acyltransferase (LPLAT)-like uncharacterized protein